MKGILSLLIEIIPFIDELIHIYFSRKPTIPTKGRSNFFRKIPISTISDNIKNDIIKFLFSEIKILFTHFLFRLKPYKCTSSCNTRIFFIFVASRLYSIFCCLLNYHTSNFRCYPHCCKTTKC